MRSMHDVCGEMLVLETIVCDATAPIAMLADETGAVNQALEGLGYRPSPTFIVTALNRLGFWFVYGTNSPTVHPDFLFEWRNNGDIQRDGAQSAMCVRRITVRCLEPGVGSPCLVLR
jgi:hypothetical protein